MAERYEIVIDFSKYAPGTKLQLLNLGVPNSTDFDNTGKVMQFEVVNAFDKTNNALPTGALNPNKEVWDLKETDIQGTTKIDALDEETELPSTTTARTRDGQRPGSISASGSTTTHLGGRHRLQLPEGRRQPGPGDVQIWEITNKSGGWFHPVHIHLVDFKMLTRNGKAAFSYERGPKDVAYVGENETVRAIMRFEAGDPTTDGRYMIHCHNLPHEDHDMMTQFRVGAPGCSDRR